MLKNIFRGFASSLIKIPLLGSYLNNSVWLRGRVHKIRTKGSLSFLVLRQQSDTVQCCILKSNFPNKSLFKTIETLPPESVIDIYGQVAPLSKPTSCTSPDIEIQVSQVKILSKSQVNLPFTYDEGLLPDRVGLKVRLDHRYMDLRLPINQKIFKISSVISEEFRNFLTGKGFTEIHTPKITSGGTEGGSEVFFLKYFENDAALAQSPQLYKQMALMGDLEKVFEVGPVFRSENSNTNRHLCEFTGMDLEMQIENNYFEVIGLVYEMLLKIFEEIEKKIDLEYVLRYFNAEKVKVSKDLVMISFEDACKIIEDHGGKQEIYEDLNTENEKLLGKAVKEKYGVDLYVVHSFPTDVRPFYSQPCRENPKFSCAFDFFLRGEEIASGSQRINDYEELKEKALSRMIPLESISDYLESFKFGAFPHAGCGLGLERLIMLYTGANNIRFTSLFPRDPKRLSP